MHPSDIKAAVMAALMEGQGVNEVAERFKLPKQTVSDWKKDAGDPSQFQSKKSHIESLVLKLLETNLETLQIQSEFFRTKDWLERQDAAGNAVLHGVVTDKSIRILEALERGSEQAKQKQGADRSSEGGSE